MTEAVDPAIRARAVQAAQGFSPFDLLLAGGTVVDVVTGELRAADIGCVGPLIASVHAPGQRRDAAATHDVTGRFLAPGFIDSHLHFESSHMLPADYAAVVVPAGTTTAAWDPHEIANVLGLPGMRWAVAASRGLPLRVLVLAPSCVPSAPGLEVAGAEIGPAEMAEMLSWPEVAGVAEVMDMPGVLAGDPRMAGIVAAGIAAAKNVNGHGRGLTDGALQGYVASGVTSDHEITSAEDLLIKLRAGLTVELRGSHDYVLPDAVVALNALPGGIPPTLVLCTDDVLPDELVAKGGLRDVIARVIARGMAPVAAIRCATLNAALRLKRDDLGVLAPGRRADIAVLADLASVAVTRTYAAGRLVAADGALCVAPARPADVAATGSMHLAPLSPHAFRMRVARSGRVRLRAISGARFTRFLEVEADAEAGIVRPPENVSLLASIHRHGRADPTPRIALIHDWGEFRGAIATTVAHDSHNLLVFGREAADMAAAANAVIATGGGMAVAQGGAVTALFPLPVAGLLATTPPAETAAAFAALRKAADAVCDWQPPYRIFRAVTGASLACNPGPHLTDRGIAEGGRLYDPAALLADHP